MSEMDRGAIDDVGCTGPFSEAAGKLTHGDIISQLEALTKLDIKLCNVGKITSFCKDSRKSIIDVTLRTPTGITRQSSKA